MISPEILLEAKDRIEEIAEQLSIEEDIPVLIDLLKEKEDNLRYPAFLLLKQRSVISRDIYPYWSIFCDKIANENSYQRSIGIMLIAENVRWDKECRLDDILEEYLSHTEDEKFITSRQTIQSIKIWIKKRPDLSQLVYDRLSSIKVDSLKETQKKLLLIDIIDVFIAMLEIKDNIGIKYYINQALTGAILDKKSVKEITKRIK